MDDLFNLATERVLLSRAEIQEGRQGNLPFEFCGAEDVASRVASNVAIVLVSSALAWDALQSRPLVPGTPPQSDIHLTMSDAN